MLQGLYTEETSTIRQTAACFSMTPFGTHKNKSFHIFWHSCETILFVIQIWHDLFLYMFTISNCLVLHYFFVTQKLDASFELKELAIKPLYTSTISNITTKSLWWISQYSCPALRTILNSCGGPVQYRVELIHRQH